MGGGSEERAGSKGRFSAIGKMATNRFLWKNKTKPQQQNPEPSLLKWPPRAAFIPQPQPNPSQEVESVLKLTQQNRSVNVAP